MPLGDHLGADQHVDLAVAKPRQQRRRARPCVRIASRSSRATRAAGTALASPRASTRSVPKPACSRYGPAHERTGASARAPSSCSSGSARAAPVPSPCTTSETLQFGTIDRAGALPAEDRGREAAAVQQHQRLLAAASSRASIAVAQRAAEHDVRARRRRTPRACRRRSPRRAAGRAPGARARRARTCRSSRGGSSPSTASPSRARPARRRAAPARSRRRGRCSAGSRPACTRRRAPRRR